MTKYNALFHKLVDFERLVTNDKEAKETYESMGEFCYENEKYTEAFECFIPLRDYERATDCIKRMLESVQCLEGYLELTRYFNRIPDSYSEENPQILILKGLSFLLSDDYINASKKLYEAFNHSVKVDDDGLKNDLYVGLGIVETLKKNPYSMIFFRMSRHCQKERTIIKNEDILRLLSNTSPFLFEDDSDATDDSLQATIDYIKNTAVYLNELTENLFNGWDDLYVAKVKYAVGDFNKALEYSMKTIVKTMSMMCMEIRLEALFLRLKIMIFKGDYEGYEQLYSQIADEAQNKNTPATVTISKFVENWAFTKIFDFKTVSNRYQTNRKQIYDKSLSIKSEELINHAHMYIKKEEFHNALGIISSIEEDIKNYKDQWATVLLCNIMKAVSYYSLGEKKVAYDYLWDAYDKSHQHNMVIPFAEYGSHMRNLMNNMEKFSHGKFSAEWIEAVRKKSSYYAKNISKFKRINKTEDITSVEKLPILTSKEVRVLDYLAQGFTINEISKLLFISSSAVKKHATNIYEKLGASNRAEAIHIATNKKLI